MVPNTGIKASSPLDETHPQNMTATCFLSSQQIKCGTCFLSFFITTIVSSEKKQLFPVFFCPASLLLTKKHSCLSISRSNQIILLKYPFF